MAKCLPVWNSEPIIATSKSEVESIGLSDFPSDVDTTAVKSARDRAPSLNPLRKGLGSTELGTIYASPTVRTEARETIFSSSERKPAREPRLRNPFLVEGLPVITDRAIGIVPDPFSTASPSKPKYTYSITPLSGLTPFEGDVYTFFETAKIMRFMGLDVGDKRIGIALSDESATIASPTETLQRRGNRKDIAHLLNLARREMVTRILVGMPYSLDGSSGPQALKVSRFVTTLAAETEIPVTTWDERFTTVDAEIALREAKVSPSARRAKIDRSAAAIILQSYLDDLREKRAEY